jgi:hypothetical protein
MKTVPGRRGLDEAWEDALAYQGGPLKEVSLVSSA